jgi:hypothetical protein
MKPHPYLASLLIFTATAVNAETVQSQRIDIPAAVQRVVIETPGDLEIRPGTAGRLTIEAEPHVLRKLDNTPQQDTLTLGSKDSFSIQHRIRYTLEIPKLQSLTARGSGAIQIGAFKGDTLELELAGNGDATVRDIAFKHFALRISGSGDIDINGRGETLAAEITGSGNIRAENLAVTRAETKITGAGDITVNTSQHLTAAIAGAGNIRYKGQPQITPSISGIGTINSF